jgi:transposase
MRKLRLPDAEIMILALQDEIRRSGEARYDHRLHGLLLVAHGMSCREVAQLLGDSPRTVEYWVRRFEQEGLAGLVDGDRPGRPKRLTEKQLDEVAKAMRKSPEDFDLAGRIWDGKTLSAWIEQQFDITLGVRQCQRLFRSLGFRLRKPRPLIAHADPELQAKHKKNSATL